MLILAIETSCDETSIAIRKDGSILANMTAHQISVHKKFGGVVPEKASRLHFQVIDQVFRATIKSVQIEVTDLTLIVYTDQPGLTGCLKIGQVFAESLALLLGVPVQGVNHLHGHLAAGTIKSQILFPAVGLVVSGGHTDFYYMPAKYQFQKLGMTIDDAAGECLDKIGRYIGLPYPAGPLIEKMASRVHNHALLTQFPAPTIKVQADYSFSFSGLKTFALQFWQRHQPKQMVSQAEFCYLVQAWVINYLLVTTAKLVQNYPDIKSLVLGGGVAANQVLRHKWTSLAQQYDLKPVMPPVQYCTDNAAMIAMAANLTNMTS